MHGDAAFAGQGVVAETLNLSQLRGYRTGGTVHVIVNNQVGFTTAPEHSRSSVYATDVARMIQAPIFHVNGDDPEAVVMVARLAFEFRQAFHKDVVVDMLCYRRRGHNEADDPSLTQPKMYERIDLKRSVRKRYTEGLVGRGDITVEEAEQALRDFQEQLERAHREVREAEAVAPPTPTADGRAGSPRRRHGRRSQRHRRRRAHPDRAARGLPLAPAARAAAAASRADGDRRHHRLGHGRDARHGLAARRRAARCGSPVRTAAAAPSASGTPSSSTASTATPTSR